MTVVDSWPQSLFLAPESAASGPEDMLNADV